MPVIVRNIGYTVHYQMKEQTTIAMNCMKRIKSYQLSQKYTIKNMASRSHFKKKKTDKHENIVYLCTKSRNIQ